MIVLPPTSDGTNAAAYEAAILAAVQHKQHVLRWTPLTSTIPGHTATFQVAADALSIDGVRWGMGARLMQQVGDLVGASFLTPKLMDLMYQQRAATLVPEAVGMLGLSYVTDLMKTSTMKASSAAIDAQIAKAGSPPGILQSIGKPWVLVNALLERPGKACNYGWYAPVHGSEWLSVPVYPATFDTSLRVIQQPGFDHGLNQSDYSEMAVLVRNVCTVDGQPSTFQNVAQDPNLAALVSHEGPLRVLRQPGVDPPPSSGTPQGSGTSGAGGGISAADVLLGVGVAALAGWAGWNWARR